MQDVRLATAFKLTCVIFLSVLGFHQIAKPYCSKAPEKRVSINIQHHPSIQAGFQRPAAPEINRYEDQAFIKLLQRYPCSGAWSSRVLFLLKNAARIYVSWFRFPACDWWASGSHAVLVVRVAATVLPARVHTLLESTGSVAQRLMPFVFLALMSYIRPGLMPSALGLWYIRISPVLYLVSTFMFPAGLVAEVIFTPTYLAVAALLFLRVESLFPRLLGLRPWHLLLQHAASTLFVLVLEVWRSRHARVVPRRPRSPSPAAVAAAAAGAAGSTSAAVMWCGGGRKRAAAAAGGKALPFVGACNGGDDYVSCGGDEGGGSDTGGGGGGGGGLGEECGGRDGGDGAAAAGGGRVASAGASGNDSGAKESACAKDEQQPPRSLVSAEDRGTAAPAAATAAAEVAAPDAAAAAICTPIHSCGGGPAAGAGSAPSAAVACTDGSDGKSNLPAPTLDPPVATGAAPQPDPDAATVMRYRRFARIHRTIIKIHDVEPEQVSPGWRERVARVVAESGMQLHDTYLRSGCCELVVDAVAWQANPPPPQPAAGQEQRQVQPARQAATSAHNSSAGGGGGAGGAATEGMHGTCRPEWADGWAAAAGSPADEQLFSGSDAEAAAAAAFPWEHVSAGSAGGGGGGGGVQSQSCVDIGALIRALQLPYEGNVEYELSCDLDELGYAGGVLGGGILPGEGVAAGEGAAIGWGFGNSGGGGGGHGGELSDTLTFTTQAYGTSELCAGAVTSCGDGSDGGGAGACSSGAWAIIAVRPRVLVLPPSPPPSPPPPSPPRDGAEWDSDPDPAANGPMGATSPLARLWVDMWSPVGGGPAAGGTNSRSGPGAGFSRALEPGVVVRSQGACLPLSTFLHAVHQQHPEQQDAQATGPVVADAAVSSAAAAASHRPQHERHARQLLQPGTGGGGSHAAGSDSSSSSSSLAAAAVAVTTPPPPPTCYLTAEVHLHALPPLPGLLLVEVECDDVASGARRRHRGSGRRGGEWDPFQDGTTGASLASAAAAAAGEGARAWAVAPVLAVDDPWVAEELGGLLAGWRGTAGELRDLMMDLGFFMRHCAAAVRVRTHAAGADGWHGGGCGLPLAFRARLYDLGCHLLDWLCDGGDAEAERPHTTAWLRAALHAIVVAPPAAIAASAGGGGVAATAHTATRGGGGSGEAALNSSELIGTVVKAAWTTDTDAEVEAAVDGAPAGGAVAATAVAAAAMFAKPLPPPSALHDACDGPRDECSGTAVAYGGGDDGDGDSDDACHASYDQLLTEVAIGQMHSLTALLLILYAAVLVRAWLDRSAAAAPSPTLAVISGYHNSSPIAAAAPSPPPPPLQQQQQQPSVVAWLHSLASDLAPSLVAVAPPFLAAVARPLLPAAAWAALVRRCQLGRLLAHGGAGLLVGWLRLAPSRAVSSYHLGPAVFVGDGVLYLGTALVPTSTAALLAILRVPIYVSMWAAMGATFSWPYAWARAALTCGLSVATNAACHAGLRALHRRRCRGGRPRRRW